MPLNQTERTSHPASGPEYEIKNTLLNRYKSPSI